MLQNKAYKFRMYPTKGQEVLIHKTFGCARLIIVFGCVCAIAL